MLCCKVIYFWTRIISTAHIFHISNNQLSYFTILILIHFMLSHWNEIYCWFHLSIKFISLFTLYKSVRIIYVSHITLFQRIDRYKLNTKLYKFQYIFTILKENMFAECIPYFAVFKYLLKHLFTCIVVKEIRFNSSIIFLFNSWLAISKYNIKAI